MIPPSERPENTEVFGKVDHETILRLTNIRTAVARARHYGHSATKQTPEHVIARKDELLDQALSWLAELGFGGSVLRNQISDGEAAAMLKGIDDIKYGRIVTLSDMDAKLASERPDALQQARERIRERVDGLRVKGRGVEAQAINDTAERALAVIDDELDALLLVQRQSLQQEQTNDHGAELIHQAIPDVEGTEPRLTYEESYVGKGPVGCRELKRHPYQGTTYGCTRDAGHEGEHVAVGGPRTMDKYGYFHWPSVGSGTDSASAERAPERAGAQRDHYPDCDVAFASCTCHLIERQSLPSAQRQSWENKETIQAIQLANCQAGKHEARAGERCACGVFVCMPFKGAVLLSDLDDDGA